MRTDTFPARRAQLQEGFVELSEAAPAVMKGFGAMHRAATTGGALDQRTKELMALAIGIAVHCEGCIAYHVHDARRAGATRAEIEETIGVAILMGGAPAAVYGADALRAMDEFDRERGEDAP